MGKRKQKTKKNVAGDGSSDSMAGKTEQVMNVTSDEGPPAVDEVAMFAASAIEAMDSWRKQIDNQMPHRDSSNGFNHKAGESDHSDEMVDHETPSASKKINRSHFALDDIPGVHGLSAADDQYYDSLDDGSSARANSISDDTELEKLLVPKIKSFELKDTDSSGFLGRYIDEELHPHENGTAASPIPHSKNLVLGDNDGAVLQVFASSKAEVVEVVAEQSWLITKLTVQLLWALRMSQRWMICALRLIWFVILLLPALLKMAAYWLFDEHIHKNIIYGLNGRNLLDVYTVPSTTTKNGSAPGTSPNPSKSSPRYPVAVFITGGAWIIGYKAWGALIGKVLSSFGIVVVTPDYRNFPQGILPDMVEDATLAMQWVFDNIHLFGGDPENVTLIGQSAGAHIAMCTLLERVEKKDAGSRSPDQRYNRFASAAPSPTYSTCSNVSHSSIGSTCSNFVQPPTWELKQVRSMIGISGPYNMEASLATFHRHGFDKNVVERIMDHKLAYYSPALRFLAKSEQSNVRELLSDFPPVYLMHGTADKTVSWESSEQFSHALRVCGIPVKTHYFQGKTHTDPIIEDPICGDDFLLNEIIETIKKYSPRDEQGNAAYTLGDLTPEKRYYPAVLVKLARRINPF